TLASSSSRSTSLIRRPPGSTPFPYTTLFRSAVDERSEAGVRLDPANLYRSLRRMQADGWIGEVEGSDERRRTYRITPTGRAILADRKSTRLNSSHVKISYAVFCLKKKKT